MLVYPGEPLRRTKVEYKTLLNLPNVIGGKLSLIPGNRERFGYARPYWPEGFFRKQNSHKYVGLVNTLKPEVSVKANSVTIVQSTGPSTLRLLRSTGPFADLRWHWFFDSAIFSIVAVNVPKETALETLADALGARLVQTSGGPYLNINPSQIRTRAIALLGKMRSGAAGKDADCDYYAELLRVATNAQIMKAYEAQGRNVEILAPRGSKLHRLAVNRILALESKPVQERSPAVRDLLAKIDLDKTIIANLSSDGHIAAIYSGRDRFTQFVY